MAGPQTESHLHNSGGADHNEGGTDEDGGEEFKTGEAGEFAVIHDGKHGRNEEEDEVTEEAGCSATKPADGDDAKLQGGQQEAHADDASRDGEVQGTDQEFTKAPNNEKDEGLQPPLACKVNAERAAASQNPCFHLAAIMRPSSEF